MSANPDLLAAVQVLVQLADLAAKFETAQERFDYAAIEALCAQNRALRPALAQAVEGLKTVPPKTDEERELVALAATMVRKVRDADRSFAIWQANLGAMRVWSADGAAQSLQNAPRLCDVPPVDVMDNRFKGVPAIVVAAGPSLDKNFDLLHEVADRAVIITMNRCATIFQNAGLAPHLLVASERSEDLPEIHLKGVGTETLENFVVRPSVHPRLLDIPAKRTFLFTDGSAHEKALMEAMGKSTRPVGGGTVGHSCFLLAYHMGCDPIVLVGQDLAYGDGRAYSSLDIDADKRLVLGADGENAALCDADGQASKVGLEYDFQVESVPAWGGGKVQTSIGFRRFIDFYDVMVQAMQKESDLTLINATEGGAHLEGMAEMTLREAIDRYMTRPVDRLRERVAMTHAGYRAPVTSAQMADTIREIERQMTRLHNLASDGERLTQSKKRNPRKAMRAEEIQQRIAEIFESLASFLEDAYRGKMSMERPSDDPWDKLAAEFRALRSAVEDLLPGCRQAVRTLER